MKISNITETTTSGAVATVASPLGSTISRNPGIYPNAKMGTMFKGKKVKSSAIKEDELSEQDLILVPGQGHRLKTGFIPHDKDRTDHEVEMARSDLFQAAKNAKKVYDLVKDVSEEDGLEGWVQEKIIKANDYLNTVREYLEHKSMVRETTGGVIAGGIAAEAAGDPLMTGMKNIKSIASAVEKSTSADIELGDDIVTLEYPEARFVYGFYRQALKDGRQEDMLKTLADPMKFHKLMKIMGDMLYKKSNTLSEKAVSKAQQRFMGMVHAAQKGEKPMSKAVADVAKSMKKSDAKDFAKTKHAGLPEKVKKD